MAVSNKKNAKPSTRRELLDALQEADAREFRLKRELEIAEGRAAGGAAAVAGARRETEDARRIAAEAMQERDLLKKLLVTLDNDELTVLRRIALRR